MYSKNLIWVGSLLVSLVACSSSDGGSGPTGTSGAGGRAAGGNTGVAGAGATAGAPTTGGAPGTAGAGGGYVAGAPGGGNTSAGAGGAGTGGTPATAGAGGSVVAAGAAGVGSPPGASGLPVAPGAGDVAKPTGAGSTITVVNWAGFKGAVTYSFDDDNDSQISNYSKLQAVGGQYTFFMWTGKSQAMNAIWKTALTDGHEIGNHTKSHDSNAGCTTADINAATDFIQTNLKVKPLTMAAPNGSACFQPLSKPLFFINRGVSPASPVMPNGNSDPSNLNCYIPATGQMATGSNGFNSNVDAGRSAGGWVIYVVHGFTGDGSAYQPVGIDQMVAAITYTKSLGDMWIGSMVNVGSYWLGQKAFMAATTATSGTDKTWTWTLPQLFPTGKYLRVKTDGGTLKQGGTALTWDPHGYYEIALDAGSVTLSP